MNSTAVYTHEIIATTEITKNIFFTSRNFLMSLRDPIFSQPQATIDLSFVLYINWNLIKLYVNGVIYHVVLYVWFHLTAIITMKFFHVVTCDSNLFVDIAE
jgi:hypothetical protein